MISLSFESGVVAQLLLSQLAHQSAARLPIIDYRLPITHHQLPFLARRRFEDYAPGSMRRHFLSTFALAGVLLGCAPNHEVLDTHRTPYNVPLFSSGAQFGGLPPAVQNTVRAEAGSEEIYDIVKDNSSGQTIYRIYFVNPGGYPTLYVARDGSVLNPDLSVAVAAPAPEESALSGSNLGTTVKLTDLPAAVLEVIHHQASRSEVATIDKSSWGNRTVYIVTFKDESHYPKLYVEADGTLLKEVK